ncbi:MAG TPA: nitrilase-related carbon-nitrogen hydrolase [Nocardioidaceae bacterium]|nr:nitrilase-related carbon-nitrogen hydrolase [Nocardioidaceae bacterium]
MRISLAQLDSKLGDVDANLESAREAVETAAGESADLVAFPELFLSGYSVGEVDADLSMRPDDPRIEKLARAAGDAGVLVGFVEAGPPGPHTYNSTVYYQAGRLVHVHRKLYLPAYRPFEERNYFTPGPRLRAFDASPETRMAVLCCNDAWQPQLAFLATQDGAQVMLVPTASSQSSFPDRYDSHEYWHDITRFYGRMFQLFVVFVNRVGVEGRFRFWGGSHIIDPWGNVVAEAALNEEQVLTVSIDLAEIRRRRRQVPLVKEARLGLIRREIERLLDEGGDL